MPRPPRRCPDGIPQHIVNRGNRRAKLFLSDADYLGFLAALTEAGERTTVRLVSYCLMPNHWHLVVWPCAGPEVSSYMQIAMNLQIRDLLRRHGTGGTGHYYQGRFKNSAILSTSHFLNVCRYVEANPVVAGLVDRAENWPWSSLTRQGPAPGIDILTSWPVSRPRDWLEQVNRPQKPKVAKELRRQERAARKISALLDAARGKP